MNDRPHYPWNQGDELFADELNAAIANAGLAGFFPAIDQGGIWDATHDVGVAINAAIAAATAAGGGTVIVPAGTYNLATPLVIHASGVKLMGAGNGIPRDDSPVHFYAVTRLVWTGAAGATMLTVSPGGTQSLYENDVRGLCLDAASLANVCARFTQVCFSKIDVGVSEPRLVGFWMDTWAASGGDSPGCQNNEIRVWARSTSATYAPTGILFDQGSTVSTFNTSYNTMPRLYAWFNNGDGIVFAGSDNNLVEVMTTARNPGGTGTPAVFATAGYVMPNGMTTNSLAYCTRVLKGHATVIQGYNSALTITRGGGNTGTAAVNPLSLVTNAAAASRALALPFAATTGVIAGMTATCGGYWLGMANRTAVASVAGTSVTLAVPLTAAVASGTSITFGAGATPSAQRGTYVLTAVDATHWTTTTVPPGGTSQTNIAVAGGVLALTDLVIPLAGAPAPGDTLSVVVPLAVSTIQIEHIDQANACPAPSVEPGATAAYTLSSSPYPVNIGEPGPVFSTNVTVGLSNSVAATVAVNSAPATAPEVLFQSAGVGRWSVGPDHVAEAGSNTGAGFVLYGYADNGSLLVNPIGVTRATGLVGINNGLSFGTQLGASNTDMTKHIQLYAPSIGFSVTSLRLNYNSSAAFSHVFVVGGNDKVTISAAGMVLNGAIGFYGTTPVAKPAVTGSRGGNAALASLLMALAAFGLITDSTTA